MIQSASVKPVLGQDDTNSDRKRCIMFTFKTIRNDDQRSSITTIVIGTSYLHVLLIN